MTTTFRNVQFQNEIQSFKKGRSAAPPLVITYAIADMIKAFGASWLRTDDAKALVHLLNLATHGQAYKLDGAKEQERLEQAFD